MNRLLVIAVFALGLLPNFSAAVEIKNIRPCYAPFGATRVEPKCLPGDMLFMTYDIENLTLKDGKASYVTILELLDDKGKSIFKKESENNVVPQLGGARHFTKPGEQSNRYVHCANAIRRASSSIGSAVAPSIQVAPPSKCSCFQMGAICLIRSIA